jgi:GTP cyclohydrolase IA
MTEQKYNWWNKFTSWFRKNEEEPVKLDHSTEYIPYSIEEQGKKLWGDQLEIANCIKDIIYFLGDDPERDGMKETPNRVVKSLLYQYSGYRKKVDDILTVFDSENYDEMVLLTNIQFYSHCEHHMEPFFGKAHIAYIPNNKIVGISKLARVVDIFARRFQNQERLTNDIAKALMEHLNPQGVMVVLEGQHFCMMARGVEQQATVMKTSAILGVFKEPHNQARQEFFGLLNK